MSIKASFIVPHPPLSVPNVGRGSEKQILKTIESYNQIAKEISEIKPETIIISTPHTKIYSDYYNVLSAPILEGSFARFGAAEVSFKEENDIELVKEIDNICKATTFAGGIIDDDYNELDHGTMVPLYFIRKYLKDCKIVVIGLSEMNYISHYIFGQIINQAVENLNKDVVYIASGDLSHKLQEYGPYGFIEEGPIYEEQIIDICKKGEFESLLGVDPILCEKAAVCGHKSFIMMSGAIANKELRTKFYSHEDVTGVGYQILSYYIENDIENDYLEKYLNNEKKRLINYYNNADDYINLAKKTIDEYIKHEKVIEIPYNLNKELLNNRAGVFVSIHKYNNLRGCIGTINPVEDNVAEEIIRNAISAATNDYRFGPINKDELDYLEIKVDVLLPPEKIESISELDCKKYGVIITSGFKRGVLLPNLDNVPTVEDQIRIAKNKGNISDDEDYTIERFEVIRHKSH